MRVCINIHNQSNTGPYFKVLKLCKELSKHDITITLLCTSKKNRIRINRIASLKDNVRIVEVPDLLFGKYRQGFSFWNTINRTWFLYKEDFDIIHAIDCRPAVIFSSLIKKYHSNIPLVISWWDYFSREGTIKVRSGKLYNNTFGFVEEYFNSHFRMYADHSIAISSFLSNKLEELGIKRNNIDEIKLGSIEFINKDKPKVNGMNDGLKLPKDKTIFIYVGNIYKNDMNLLIKSLEIYFNNYGNDIVTILVGKSNLQTSLCNKLSIIKTGFVENNILLTYLMSSDYGLLPFNNNITNISRWPSKVTDYWRMGLPTIATPVGDIKTYYNKFNIGYISITDRPEDYAACLDKAVRLSKNKNIYKEQLQSIEELLNTDFNWHNIATKHLNIYNKIIN